MKLLPLITLALILCLPEMADAPLLTTGGPFHWGRYWDVVRITETEAGTVAEMVTCWREVR